MNRQLKRVWSRLGLTEDVVISMFKNALPPTAAIWLTQSTTLGKEFDMIPFLPVVVSIIEPPMHPRVFFIENMLFTCFLTCVVSCVALLAGFCSTQARAHTTPPGRGLSEYNSSAAAVSGVWLFFAVWAIQTYRSYNPRRTPSFIICTIYTVISITVSSHLSTMDSIIRWNVEMLEMWFLAHGFCTFTSLFIFPKTSRDVFISGWERFLNLSQKALGAERTYMQDVAQTPFFCHGSTKSQNQCFEQTRSPTSESSPKPSPSKKLKETQSSVAQAIASLSQQYGKVLGDGSTAKKDVSWSTVDAEDINVIVDIARSFLLPIRGLGALPSIFENFCKWRGWNDLEASAVPDLKLDSNLYDDGNGRQEYGLIFGGIQSELNELEHLMSDSTQHASLLLELQPKSILSRWRGQKQKDTESAEEQRPGSLRFTKVLENRIRRVRDQEDNVLEQWLCRKGISGQDVSEEKFEKIRTRRNEEEGLSSEEEQLFLVLYSQRLIIGIADALLRLVEFADQKTALNPLNKKKLVLPGRKRLLKLATRLVQRHDAPQFEEDATETGPDETTVFGFFHHKASSLEHLPPKNNVQKAGAAMSSAYHVIGTSQSFFGFRVACAVMSVVISALLGSTQTWFFNQRALWAAVFIPFCMAPSSGEAVALMLFRLVGSIMAVVLAIVNWYIVDGVPAGVVVFFFVFTFFEQYFLVKYPQFAGLWRPCAITRAIVTGYALQSRHTHMPFPPATVDNSYPIYLIGPYRYACTSVGVFVAFIWTIFPHATTAQSLMRKRLGRALFVLAEYHSWMFAAIVYWAHTHANSQHEPERSAHSAHIHASAMAKKLWKGRHKLFVREMALLGVIRHQAHFSRFEPSLGGDFPTELYRKIVNEIDLIISYINVVIFATTSIVETDTVLPNAGSGTDSSFNQSSEDSGLRRPTDTSPTRLDRSHHTQTETTLAPHPRPSPSSRSSYINDTADDNANANANGTYTTNHPRLAQVVSIAEPISAQITALLCLMVSSISNKQPLPPGLKAPPPFALARRLRRRDPAFLDPRNIRDPNSPYGAFAVMEVSAAMIAESLARLLADVEELVGVLDYDLRSSLKSDVGEGGVFQEGREGVDGRSSRGRTDKDKEKDKEKGAKQQ